MFGLLNIDKPQALTSRDVVNRVQRRIRPTKCGHAGTLDPLATGVLIVAVGPATRLIQFVQQQPKSYRGTFRLGYRSETEDIEGQLVELEDPPRPTRRELESALVGFRGEIMQQPPAFSALKVAGRRAHELARQGCDVQLAPRPITVHSIELLDYDYPHFSLDICCGSGTYVRSLGRDIARAMGSEAVMTALVRTATGPFLLADALSLDELEAGSIADCLLSPTQAVDHLAKLTLDNAEVRKVMYGQRLARRGISTPAAETLAGMDEEGRLQAILEARPGGLQPVCCFANYYSS